MPSPSLTLPEDSAWSNPLALFPASRHATEDASRNEKKGGGGGIVEDFTAVVLPLKGKPYEIRIPASVVSSKESLFDYLRDIQIFQLEGEYISRHHLDLGIYWRKMNRSLQFKNTPQTAIVFRFSQGVNLPENRLCQQWRDDIERKTYGTVLLMNLQESENSFRLASYDMAQYHRQLKEREKKQKGGVQSEKMITPKKSSTEKLTLLSSSFTKLTQSFIKPSNLSESIRVFEDPEEGLEALIQAPSNYGAQHSLRRVESSSSLGSLQESTLNTFSRTSWRPQKSPLRALILQGKHNLTQVLSQCVERCEEEMWNVKHLISTTPFPILYNYLLHVLLMILGTEHEHKEQFVCQKSLSSPQSTDLIIINTGLRSKHNPREQIFMSLHVHCEVPLLGVQLATRIEILRFLPWPDMIQEYSPMLSYRKEPPMAFDLTQHLEFSHPAEVQLSLMALHSIAVQQQASGLFPSDWRNLSTREFELLDAGYSTEVQQDVRRLSVPAVHVDKSADEWLALHLVPVQKSGSQMILGSTQAGKETPIVIGLRAMPQENSNANESSVLSGDSSLNTTSSSPSDSDAPPSFRVVHKGVLATTLDHAFCISRIVERPVGWLLTHMAPELIHYVQIDCSLRGNQEELDLRITIPLLLKNIRAEDLKCAQFCAAVRVETPMEQHSHHRILLLFYVTPFVAQVSSMSSARVTILGDGSLHRKACKLILQNASSLQKQLPFAMSITSTLKKDNEISKPGLLTSDMWFDASNGSVSPQVPQYCDFFYNTECCVVEAGQAGIGLHQS